MIYIDECRKIPISTLRSKGVFVPGSRGTLIIGPSSALAEYDGHELKLTYVREKVTETAKFEIVTRPTNLGIGTRMFFKCPVTDKLCTKLLLTPGGHFITRSMLIRRVYSYQDMSKRDRLTYQTRVYDNPPIRTNGKMLYRGKLTPYGKRIIRWNERGEETSSRWLIQILTRWGCL